MSRTPGPYKELVERLEYAMLMVENCLLAGEAKRALNYIVALAILTDRLEDAVNKECRLIGSDFGAVWDDIA